MNNNLNQYKLFFDICKYKSFNEASTYLYLSQPAISKAMKNLESNLNVKLFLKDKDGFMLTDEGKNLLFYLEQSFNILEFGIRKVNEYKNLEKGKLSIGMPSNIGTFYLFDKTINFHECYPNIEISIITGSTTKLIELLDVHEIDFIIDTPPFKNLNDNYNIKKIDMFNYCFISKNKENIKSLKDLENKQLILPIRGTDNRNKLDLLLDNNKIKLNNILNIHTTEMTISATLKGLGIGYVIENLVIKELKNKELYKVSIKEKLPTIDLDLVYNNKYLTITSKTFLEKYMNIDMN